MVCLKECCFTVSLFVLITDFTNAMVVPAKVQDCVAECTNKADGDYASCKSCNVFVKCTNEILVDFDCPSNLLWDDAIKRCEYESTTCSVKKSSQIIKGGCEISCEDLPDGDYPSCNGCDKYISCGGKTFYGDRPCPAGLKWNDHLKECAGNSFQCGKFKTTCESIDKIGVYSMELTCLAGKLLKIYWAVYGRLAIEEHITECPAIRPHKLKLCKQDPKRVKAKMQEFCEGKNQCSVEVTNANFGDPCRGTYKLLKVNYDCY